jgi:hypothetical protein
VRSLSLSLHEEFKSYGIHVTVLPPAVGAVTANNALAVKIAGIAWNVSHDIHASIVADMASVGVCSRSSASNVQLVGVSAVETTPAHA